MVKNIATPRGFWKLARVVSLNVSKDGLIRSVVIKVAGSQNLLIRSATALYPLELGDENFEQVSNNSSAQFTCDSSFPILESHFLAYESM